jgi:hypothetical protein
MKIISVTPKPKPTDPKKIAKERARNMLKNKPFQSMTRSEKDDLLLELLKMNGLIEDTE